MATKWAEYKRKQREKAKGLVKTESESEAIVSGIEITQKEIHARDVVAGVNRKYPDREYNEDGSLKLFGQRCDLCSRTWSASVAMTCPYCHGRIVKTA